MRRGIAFDWLLFVFGSVPLFVASVYYLFTNGRTPFGIGYGFIALMVASILH